MKRYLFFVILLCTISFVFGQKRVAVLPTSGSTEAGIKNAITEALIEALSNSKGYKLVERAAFEEIKKEQNLQLSDYMDESQTVELGRLLGAEYICVSTVNVIRDSYYQINYRLVDVSTGEVVKKDKKTVMAGEILKVINDMSEESLFAGVESKTDNKETGVKKFCGCEVQTQDYGEMALNKNDLKKACPAGWRLPTISELKCMCENKEKIGGFNYGIYYSSASDSGNPLGIIFNSCFEKAAIGKASVRCVR